MGKQIGSLKLILSGTLLARAWPKMYVVNLNISCPYLLSFTHCPWFARQSWWR